jgi:hypothetical protein
LRMDYMLENCGRIHKATSWHWVEKPIPFLYRL